MKDKLNFYTVDPAYIDYLKSAETAKRGFSRIPDMTYGQSQKPKFLCGVVLQINNCDYFVPVSSFKQKRPDNFLIFAKNGIPVSSLRFNYMFPVPSQLLNIRQIKSEPDSAYRNLLNQELSYCIRHQNTIRQYALRTYSRVLSGKNPGLVHNSCDFLLLESLCADLVLSSMSTPKKTAAIPSPTIENKLSAPRPPMKSVLSSAAFRSESKHSDSHTER